MSKKLIGIFFVIFLLAGAGLYAKFTNNPVKPYVVKDVSRNVTLNGCETQNFSPNDFGNYVAFQGDFTGHNEEVAKVSATINKLTITGIGSGNTVTCGMLQDAEGNSYNFELSIEVEEVAQTGVEFTEAVPSILLVLEVGKTYQLTWNVLPENATDKDVEFKVTNVVEDDNYITIDKNGLITANSVGCGQIEILGSTCKQGDSVQFEVTSNEPKIESLTFDIEVFYENITAINGLHRIFKNYTVKPGNACQHAIWSSSDESILSFDADGRRTAHKCGYVVITATSFVDHTIKDELRFYIYPQDTIEKGKVQELTTIRCDEGFAFVKEGSSLLEKDDFEVGWSNLESEDPSIITVIDDTHIKGVSGGVTRLKYLDAHGNVRYCSYSCYEINGPLIVGETYEFSLEDFAGFSNVYNYDISKVTDIPIKNNVSGGTLENNKVKINTETANNKLCVSFYIGEKEKTNEWFRPIYYFKVAVPVESLTVNPETLDLEDGQTAKVIADVLPLKADQTVTWISGNEKVATVNENGKVTAVGPGVTYIKAITNGINAKGEHLFAKCVVNVARDPITSVKLDKTQLELAAGGEYTLTPTILPKDANDQRVTWNIGNKNVATVDATGKVTAVGYGTTYVYCTTMATDEQGNRLKDCCKVTVTSAGLQLNKPETTIIVGSSETLTATLLEGPIQNVIWKIGNTKVATIDDNGKVTSVAPGYTYVTCYTKGVDSEGKRLSARCKVTVIPTPLESITLNNKELNLSMGSYNILTATILPENASDKRVTWNVGNKNVATVDATGKVTAVGYGTTYVYCTTMVRNGQGNRLQAICKVIVSVTNIRLNKTEIIIKVGSTEKLTSTILPEDSIQDVIWKIGNTKVATIDANGIVTAVAPGTTYVTCYSKGVDAQGKRLSIRCKVIVTE